MPKLKTHKGAAKRFRNDGDCGRQAGAVRWGSRRIDVRQRTQFVPSSHTRDGI